jgi:2-polyprenyl-3-methyl-5-hydroxy-6-metoxy-1,4-benzoquinol methylase
MNTTSESTSDSRASRFFDRYAVDFDAIYGNDNRALDRVINRLFRRAMVVRYQKTLAGCQPVEGRSVLDVGCGPGHYSVALAKGGASKVVGLDFAGAMLTIAKRLAEAQGVAHRCSFELGDFLTHPLTGKFDHVIVMGFMDYVREPERVVDRVLDLVTRRAFFSFPADGGVLAWQRKLRYRKRCDLYMYGEEQIHRLMSRTGAPFSVERIGRDFFVTLDPKSSA